MTFRAIVAGGAMGAVVVAGEFGPFRPLLSWVGDGGDGCVVVSGDAW